jgi:hypothetical protein
VELADFPFAALRRPTKHARNLEIILLFARHRNETGRN